jgi:hypothetical protein
VRIGWPLVRLHADGDGGKLVPRWRWSGVGLLFREYTWLWADVTRLEVRTGPFDGVHGLRVVLAERPQPRVARRNGLLYRRFVNADHFVLGIQSDDVEALLLLAPGDIPRVKVRGVFASD